MDPLCRFLAWKYGARSLLCRDGVLFPVACRPAPAVQWRQVNSVLGELDLTPPAEVRLDPMFDAKGLFNGPVYARRGLRSWPALQMDVQLGSYFGSMNTCEALEMELLAHLPSLRGDTVVDFKELDRRLERRAALDDLVPAIGVATLVVCQGELLLGRLAAKSMPHRAGQWHVVPSGMFAPPYSIVDTVAEELREELGVQLDPARLYLSGIAINLLNLRPEVCTVLLLDGHEEFRLSSEFLPGLTRVPFTTEADLIRTLGLHARTIAPAGAAAVFLGLRLLRKLRP
ncbi:hypothetical protein [uncultured Paludibaculum sp.]|uniref:hypothetical protein n=1 Tax=uncultured Paludibaculum sp. TaxID=1765020 RepID=UPI002AAC1A55|nr:hypothetical protein [uncultured Paludibaculum sp.]